MRAIKQLTSAMLIWACLATVARAQNQMPWQPNLETAQRLAAQTNRLVLIHFWAPWCRPCLRLEQEVFTNPETAKGLEANFVLVKLNADDSPGTARMYGVSSLPSDVITLPSGQLVSQIQSPPTSAQYVQQMNQAAAGHQALARRASESLVSNSAPAAAMPPAAAPQATAPADIAPTAAPAADPYAEYFPSGQTAAASAAPQNPVMPAQAYVPATAPAADPYAQPASTAPPATGPSNPYETPAPAANPYAAPPAEANPYAAAPPANPYAAAPPANPYAAAPPANPYEAPMATPAAPPAGQPPAANPYAAPATTAANQAVYQPAANLPQVPPGCPPLALDGNCPVTLVERKRWAVGHPTFGVVHRGRTYLFLGPQERDKFLADPDHFSPMLSGLDPVHALDGGQSIPGKREYGVFGADGKIYLFADEATRAKFEQNEVQYSAAAKQAMQQPAYQAMRQGP